MHTILASENTANSLLTTIGGKNFSIQSKEPGYDDVVRDNNRAHTIDSLYQVLDKCATVFVQYDVDKNGFITIEELPWMLHDYLGHSLTSTEVETWQRCFSFVKEGYITLTEFLQAAEHFGNGGKTLQKDTTSSFLRRISDAYHILQAKREAATNSDSTAFLTDRENNTFPPVWDGKSSDLLIAHVHQQLSVLRNARNSGKDGMTSISRLSSLPLAKTLVACQSAPHLFPNQVQLKKKIRDTNDLQSEKKVRLYTFACVHVCCYCQIIVSHLRNFLFFFLESIKEDHYIGKQPC